MRLKIVWPAACALALILVAADNAAAQQTLNFSFGYFAVRGEDARIVDDVIVENRPIYTLDVGDFSGATVGAEWLVPIGEFLEAGAGIQFTRRTVPTTYLDVVRPDGREIEQEFKLRMVPMTATLRVLPLGNSTPVQPYVGGGIGIINWRYSEVGDFVDFSQEDWPVFAARYEADGTSIGPVAVFGVRVPVDRFAAGFEARYQKAEGDLDTNDFLAPKIDLGGWHYQGTFGIRF